MVSTSVVARISEWGSKCLFVPATYLRKHLTDRPILTDQNIYPSQIWFIFFSIYVLLQYHLQVADFLCLRRDVLFLEYDATMRHSLRETFLSMGNLSAYKSSTDSIYFSLMGLSNVQTPSLFNTHLPVPEPLQPRDWKATEMFPWRTHLGR